jgi:uncharacterized protein (TIGR03083 family)
MSDRSFAPWVEPVADRLAQSQQEIEEIARQVPGEAWAKASAYPGWSYKDHLAHLPHAHRGLHGVLQAVVEGRDPDFSRFDRINELNEENRQAHLTTPVDQLIAAFVKESEGTQCALSELRPEHAEVRFGPMTISQALQGFAMHDVAHGEEITRALQA